MLFNVILAREEGTVALTSNQGEDGGRGVCRVGDEFEPILVCRPANRCIVLDNLKLELIRVVADAIALVHATPVDMVRDSCRNRVPVLQSIHDGKVVLDIPVLNVY